MQTLLWHARYALRQLLKTPAFTLAALLTLALGIGVNAAMFSVIDQVLLRPLPYKNADRLVKFGPVDPVNPQNYGSMSLPDLRDMAARSHSLQAIGYFTFQIPTLGGASSEPKITPEITASTNLFDLIGVRPMLGRGFVPDDGKPGHNNVLVLGYTVWQQSFHGNRGIVGSSVTIDGDPYSVIGVLPPNVEFPGNVGDAIYSPLVTDDKSMQDRDNAGLMSFGLLLPGVPVSQARAELNSIRRQLRHDYPKEEGKDPIRVESYRDSLTDDARPALNALNFAVIAVWLIACANVAGLMLTRFNARRREIAIVTALGAPRATVARQFLTESLILGLAGGAAGLGLAALILHVLRHYLADAVLYGSDIHINAGVCIYLFVASLVSAVLFGLAPAWAASRLSLQEGLREGAAATGVSRKQAFWRDALVVTEFTLTLALLIAAGLMMRTLLMLRHAELGFDAGHVVTGDLYLPTHGVWWANQDAHKANLITTLWQPLAERLQHTPGILSAGLTTVRPLQPNWSFNAHTKIKGETYPDQSAQPEAVVRAATAGYFITFGVRLLQGRFFDHDVDTLNSPIALVVNEAFAKKVFPSGSPLGRQVEVGDEKTPAREWGTIVGVADNVRQRSAGEAPQPEVDIDLGQLTPQDDLYPILSSFLMNVAVRTHLPTSDAENAIRTAVHQLQPEIGIDKLEPMQQVVDDSMGNQTLAARLLALFAVAALLIAVAGIYGLLSYTVTQRTREFGVRLALGAPQSSVHWLVLRRALILLGIGIAAGISLAVLASSILRAFIYGFRGYDVFTVFAVAAILALCGLAASYLPARRAAKVDPMVALRTE
ncbi:MAG TPA: ABC transporter permease [Acidobacteriaceae bacterium]|jgi:predicted permease|nr:ABC transporter permease [Acidobacteriaceae bacterium]